MTLQGYGQPPDWDSATYYPPGQTVISAGSIYRAVNPLPGVAPPGAGWTLVVSGGGGGGLPTGLDFTSPCLTVASDFANQAVICGSATGDPVTLSATGSDTDVPVAVLPKGAGRFLIGTTTPLTSVDLPMDGFNGTNPLVAGSQSAKTLTESSAVFTGYGDFNSNLALVTTIDPTGVDPQYNVYTGLANVAYVPASNAQIIDELHGVVNWAVFQGTGGLNILAGALNYAANTHISTGTTLNLFGSFNYTDMWADATSGTAVSATILVESGVTVGTVTGLQAGIVNSGTVTTGYGLFIGRWDSPTTAYAWYYDGDTNKKAWLDGAGQLTLQNRTGTPATAAAFDSGGKLVEVAGVDGTFTTADAKTVTVTKGIITSIV